MDQDNLLQDTGDQSRIDPDKDYFSELVGEGKKFKTPADLARAKAESDLYIETLTKGRDLLRQDYLQLREEYQARAKLEELVNQLSAQNKQPASSDENLNANEDNKPKFDPKELDSLVSNKILEYENTKKQTENFNSIKAKLQERYGSNYKETLATQISELGLTDTEVNNMARNSPKLLIKALGLDTPVQQEDTYQAPPRSMRTDGFTPRGTEKKTWSYFEKMRKDNPKQYWDPKTQVQMHQSHMALGREFEDGTWKALN